MVQGKLHQVIVAHIGVIEIVKAYAQPVHMEELAIERLIGKDNITITLTEDELEKAYRIKEKRYLEEDFANALADAAQNPDTRFHTGHLEEFPELLVNVMSCALCLCLRSIQ